eukprot:CAMPEP_0119546582 /NCGR_PEP_ID=MMETSP1352-20130426/940_1 /TAXON_ID=265584 /ORGANISM="Stauroneis constricta, Strain CCMP1120" /LENGTH=888 /DNA_ID=CAMNT_0007591301 /DNA_START=81 /DNA_END=2747 /DNA_ORIENTATION=-
MGKDSNDDNDGTVNDVEAQTVKGAGDDDDDVDDSIGRETAPSSPSASPPPPTNESRNGFATMHAAANGVLSSPPQNTNNETTPPQDVKPRAQVDKDGTEQPGAIVIRSDAGWESKSEELVVEQPSFVDVDEEDDIAKNNDGQSAAGQVHYPPQIKHLRMRPVNARSSSDFGTTCKANIRNLENAESTLRSKSRVYSGTSTVRIGGRENIDGDAYGDDDDGMTTTQFDVQPDRSSLNTCEAMVRGRPLYDQQVSRPDSPSNSSSFSYDNTNTTNNDDDDDDDDDDDEWYLRTSSSNAAVPIAAELSPNDEDAERAMQERLEQQYQRRLEIELRERITQHHNVAPAVLVCSTTADDIASLQSSPESHEKEGRSETATSKISKYRYRLMFGAALVVTAAVGIIVGVTLGRSSSKSSEDQSTNIVNSPGGNANGDDGKKGTIPTASPTLAIDLPQDSITVSPSQSPSSMLSFLSNQFMELLLPMLEGEPSFTTRSSFDDVDSPHFQALDWIANTYQLPATHPGEVPMVFNDSNISDIQATELDPLELQHLLESYILALIYFSTGGPDWEDQLHFATQAHICDLSDGEYGISCSPQKTVQHLNLGTNGLVGSMPPELFLLSDLVLMSFIGNDGLDGSIASHIGELQKLTWLDVSVTLFSGTIPSEIGKLTDLEILMFDDTLVGGTLPTQLGNLGQLRWLTSYGSDINGTIPSELGGLSNLVTLYIFETELSGTIPTELSRLTSLIDLSLEATNIVGNLDPIFCLPTISFRSFWSSCAGGTSAITMERSLVTCSCCSHCCTNAGNECARRSIQSLPCYHGECASCGSNRFVPSCESCVDLDQESFPFNLDSDSPFGVTDPGEQSPQQLCKGSCEWDSESDICKIRTDFPFVPLN